MTTLGKISFQCCMDPPVPHLHTPVRVEGMGVG